MELVCHRCGGGFDTGIARAYCDGCVVAFKEQGRRINQIQHPTPDIWLDGRFVEPDKCPQTIQDENNRTICGMCGSDEVEPGYGLGSGYGMGSYQFCFGCNTFLDFNEDLE